MSRSKHFCPKRSYRLAVMAGAIAVSGCVAAAPLVQPMLTRVLVDVATAQFVGENCGTLAFDTTKARAAMDSVYNRLVASGTPEEELEAQAETFEDEALSQEVADRLETGGVNAADPDPENVCAFGEAEQSKDSFIGRLLL